MSFSELTSSLSISVFWMVCTPADDKRCYFTNWTQFTAFNLAHSFSKSDVGKPRAIRFSGNLPTSVPFRALLNEDATQLLLPLSTFSSTNSELFIGLYGTENDIPVIPSDMKMMFFIITLYNGLFASHKAIDQFPPESVQLNLFLKLYESIVNSFKRKTRGFYF